MGGSIGRREVRAPAEMRTGASAGRKLQLVARDIMEMNPVVVTLDASLLNVHHVLVEEEIHGAPVVSEDEVHVVGVVSSLDLLRAVQDVYESGATVPNYFREHLLYSGPDWINDSEDFQDRLSQLRVRDVMSRDIVSVTEQATVAEIAKLMLEQRIHRVLVVEEDELRGLVTSFDLLRVLAGPT